jgi:SAM-dependent methyltransferase
MDVGCANGYLLECLVGWAAERGVRLVPYGVDIGPRLIAEARRRLPDFASHFWVGEAWSWRPPRRFRYVYSLADCVPEELVGRYARRLLERTVEPGGRLILGSYGSRSRGAPPWPIKDMLRDAGLVMAGSSAGGYPPVTVFAWVDRPGALQRQ